MGSKFYYYNIYIIIIDLKKQVVTLFFDMLQCYNVTIRYVRRVNALKINAIRETYPQKACSKVT